MQEEKELKENTSIFFDPLDEYNGSEDSIEEKKTILRQIFWIENRLSNCLKLINNAHENISASMHNINSIHKEAHFFLKKIRELFNKLNISYNNDNENNKKFIDDHINKLKEIYSGRVKFD